MTNRTMVFGDDGSPAADLAWLWINSHAWPAWRIEVVSAQDPPQIVASETPPTAKVWNPPHPRLAFTEARFAEVVELTVDEDPRLALSRASDLLVIGPRGRGMLKAMHMGSTAAWLMARPPAPMVVVRHGRPTRSVTVCHDGSAHADAATAALCRFPWIVDHEVTLVVVDDGLVDVTATVGRATEVLRATGADVRSTVLYGDPTPKLLSHLEQHPTDLVALGTHGLTGIRRFKVGSTAGVVAHGTDATVLLACAHEPAD